MSATSNVADRKEPTSMEWLNNDKRKANGVFAQRSDPKTGVEDVDVARYTSKEFHDLEINKMWNKVWQMACHESEIPEVGSYLTYEIGKQSWIIVRSAKDEIRAHANSCLHRGMTLTEGKGNKLAFSCTFHGWSWSLDGSLSRITEDWDFPQCKDEDMSLPQAKVARWGGFVFINPDPNAKPFEEYIGNLSAHFANDPLEERKVAVHGSRVIACNWKIAQEAFMESYHVNPTHPQSVPVSQYAETQVDIFPDCPNSSRLWTVSVAPISERMQAMPAQEFADWAAEYTWREKITLKPGEIYRNALADERRVEVAKAKGKSVDHLTDSEMLDAIQYMIFPNFLPWYGYGVPIAYRFRPNGDRHDSCIMEVYVLAARNVNEPCPPAPDTLWVGDNELFATYPQLGRLGPIFDQDLGNIPGIQRGLEAAVANGRMKGIKLSAYQEARIRHYHNLIGEYVAK